MARILRGITELGREECERRVAHAFASGESLTTTLLVPLTTSAATAEYLSLVPKNLDVEVESSSVSGFDALMLPATIDGAA